MAIPNKSPDDKQSISGVPITLGTRVDVYPSTPLPEFNCIGGPAFAARLKSDARRDLMAIICNTGLPARSDSVNAMRMIDHSSVLRLVDSGVVAWPDGTRYFALAYERPLAPRFMTSLEENHTALSEDAINHYFVTPMAGALSELQRTGIVHGGIRPTNIFWREGGVSPPQLGECLASPAGLGQPSMFEPLQRAMSPAIGRGPGMHQDDCYAFGVMLSFLVLGQNPLQGLDDQSIIQMKMERGSFNTMVGTHRLPASHIELLRGLLTDDTRQRWSAADLDQWLEGRRFTPKSTDAGRRASRGFTFCGKDYWQTCPLAAAFANKPSEAAPLIESGAVDKWLRRAMGDDERASNLDDALNSIKESGKTANFEEQLVARSCIVLDPSGPIRYRGIAVMPGGVAGMLAETMVTGGNLSVLSEIITSQLVTFWVNMQREIKTEMVPLAQQLERMRVHIEKTTFGSGIERVAYELNPTLACLSPMLRTQYVMQAKDLLPALERVATQTNRPREPMDRHIAAFLVVRDKRSDRLFDAMSSQEGSIRRGLAMLTLFSEMQYKHGPERLPNVSLWLLPLIESSIHRYFGKALREKLHKQIREETERGDLTKLIKLIDEPKRVEHDQQGFMAARLVYINILREIADLELKLSNQDIVVKNTGRPTAAIISSVLAICLVGAAVVKALLHTL